MLRATNKRGLVARKLDLALTKVRLLETYGSSYRCSSSLEALESAQREVRRLTVEFQDLCRVIDEAPARRVRTAFVTFETQQMRDVCLDTYEDKDGYVIGELTNGMITGCFQPRDLVFVAKNEKLRKQKERFTIRCTRAPEPENIIWENLGLDLFERSIRYTISFAFTLVFLFVSFTLIIHSMNYQERVRALYPDIDCKPYIVDPFPCFENCTGYTNINLENSFTSASLSEGVTIEGDRLTPQIIIQDQRPDDYNFTEGNAGYLRCFCKAIATKEAVGCQEKENKKQCGPEGMLNFEFSDPNGPHPERSFQYCKELTEAEFSLVLAVNLAVLGVIVINISLKQILRILVDLEAPP